MMCLSIITILRRSCSSTMFVCAMIFVNNSVPNYMIGKANGLSQTISALFRTFGPTICGFLWSWNTRQNFIGHHYIPFLLIILVIIILLIITFYIPWYIQLTWLEQINYHQTKQKEKLYEEENKQKNEKLEVNNVLLKYDDESIP